MFERLKAKLTGAAAPDTTEETMTEEQEVNKAADTPDSNAGKGLSPAMQIRDRIIAVLKTVYDPEIPVDIYELGLVYGVDVTDDGEAVNNRYSIKQFKFYRIFLLKNLSSNDR